jgi:hypothetical protein
MPLAYATSEARNESHRICAGCTLRRDESEFVSGEVFVRHHFRPSYIGHVFFNDADVEGDTAREVEGAAHPLSLQGARPVDEGHAPELPSGRAPDRADGGM